MVYLNLPELEKLEAVKASNLWLPLDTFGYLTFPYLYRTLLGLTEPYRALQGLTGPYWVLLGLTGSYWDLLGLLSLTGPYWSFIAFAD